MESLGIDILTTLTTSAPKWLQGLGALAVAKGITGIYQKQYGKIKSLSKLTKTTLTTLDKIISEKNSMSKDEIVNELIKLRKGVRNGTD